ncbi:hypothetical protein P0082_10205 [Candidatus Haliotispira prima]|uniref:Uncharacterized protein n=1 Tax=Candidatus Haliotispira prima TaxID=3034016 RepID=A0ABY8MG60_9SPIO|nr:hypothetical protein P0082_10205 [Candidatus Haliotispira prima]
MTIEMIETVGTFGILEIFEIPEPFGPFGILGIFGISGVPAEACRMFCASFPRLPAGGGDLFEGDLFCMLGASEVSGFFGRIPPEIWAKTVVYANLGCVDSDFLGKIAVSEKPEPTGWVCVPFVWRFFGLSLLAHIPSEVVVPVFDIHALPVCGHFLRYASVAPKTAVLLRFPCSTYPAYPE